MHKALRDLSVGISFFLVSFKVNAVPAFPREILCRLADGTEVFITLKGDEYCKWALTEDGYTLLPSDSAGWCFAQADSAGRAVRSAYALCADNRRSDALQQFLSGQPKGMVPAVSGETTVRRAEAQRRLQRQSVAAVGERRALVILMAFSDLEFQKDATDFDALFNEAGYQEDGAQGSVYDYFLEASCGQLLLRSDVLGPYRSSFPMAYYGMNVMGGSDANPYALFAEAVQYAASEVSLADYDADGDGYVDNIHIVFAGYGEEAGASSDAIWSHEASFSPVTVQGMYIDRYSCTPELRGNSGTGISRIGPCCHEMGHALGTMDYYDTDYSTGGYYEGTGEWDVMASGSWNNDGITPPHFNPYTMAYDFGWVEVDTLGLDGSYALQPAMGQKQVVYRLDTSSEGDYYLLESRVRSGFDASLPGEGLMVYHVHPDVETGLAANTVNASAPQLMYPVCASSTVATPASSASSYGDINTAGCPFPGTSGKTSFGSQTVPAAFAWDGSEVGFELQDIALLDDGQVTFTLSLSGGDAGEWATLWTESFESSAAAALWNPSAWEYVTLDDGGLASVVSWYTMTEAADGTGYMRLGSKALSAVVEDALLSPSAVENADGTARLGFCYAVKSRYGGTGAIDVYAVHEDSGLEEAVLTADASDGGWTEALAVLPQSDDPLRIRFVGRTEGMAYVCLDAVSVQRVGTVDVPSVLPQADGLQIDIRDRIVRVACPVPSRLSVYALDGRLEHWSVCEAAMHTLRLSAGWHILKAGGAVRKIWLK